MKLTKLSLVAAFAASMAMAGGDIEPVEPTVMAPEPAAEAPAPAASNDCGGCGKISGTAKLYYGTSDAGSFKLFNAGKIGGPNQGNSIGDVYADLKYSRKLSDTVSVNVGIAGLSTLGLENALVSGTWASHGANAVNDAFWVNEANAVINLPGKTFIKAGRQFLDTPFFYSETWSIATNSFDAIVVGNTALPGTTLVGAYVGRGNGRVGTVVDANNTDINGGMKPFMGAFGLKKSAYAAAIINNSLPNTTLQGWYYKIPSIADAYWLQADTKLMGFDFGLQYAAALPTNFTKTNTPAKNDTNAWALKLGYGADNWSVYGAYSQRNNKQGIDISNIATGVAGNPTQVLGGGESRLYTEAYWNYGQVGSQNAKSIALGGSYDLGLAKLGAQYTMVGTKTGKTDKLGEFALTADTKLGPVDVNAAYVNAKVNNGSSSNTLLFMLSLPYSL